MLRRIAALILLVSIVATRATAEQIVTLNGGKPGPTFDGIGAVSGGGATSVLLKDYPQTQRDQLLDLLFKPNFAASMPSLYVEVGGDGNSTQGTEPSHQRSASDENYFRGYEWWLMREAKQRNPQLTLDACAWSAPGWIGNGQFWSQDMADYYVKWVKGLKEHHGLMLDAIGCRNERGAVLPWVKIFRRTLDAAGLRDLPIHAFDDPGDKRQWQWIPQLLEDKEAAAAIAIIGNHGLTNAPMPDAAREAIGKLEKRLWNTEEHVYGDGGEARFADEYAAALGCLHLFNANFIERGATKIINWYLVGSTYACEPYADQPPALIARSPWSGHYRVKPILWSYAHYGQFVRTGWKYLPSGCTKLDGGGTMVTMRSDDGDYSLMIETAGAAAKQAITIKPISGLSGRPLCAWKTTRAQSFVRQPDLSVAADGSFTLTLEPDAMLSLSTTIGQQKGEFTDIPTAKPFPLPYFDDFDHYGDPQTRGYLPRYTADIVGVFELSPRRDGRGSCLRQVITQKAQSWAPEWMPYTILGDESWTDYEVSADVQLDNGGWAGVMGRVHNTGNGWDNDPDGYYCRLYADGGVQLYSASSKYRGSRDRQLGQGQPKGRWAYNGWHRLTLRFVGKTITVLVDQAEVIRVENDEHAAGLAGLITAGEGKDRVAASFDNLLINTVDGKTVDPAAFSGQSPAIYSGRP